MGYERQNKSIQTADIQIPVKLDPVTRQAAEVDDVLSGRPAAASSERNLLREARLMRDEWRRNRFSRLVN